MMSLFLCLVCDFFGLLLLLSKLLTLPVSLFNVDWMLTCAICSLLIDAAALHSTVVNDDNGDND